ncbi:DUF1427 family protein [Cupriavidus lacunae]|uniref:XapX domain-containing protein n=1 Tax=Cupriavidus lacunae TaxID=2666307 RepID=A0A370NI99_9BURK|nr:DUF1427 family protein [Cupriavidus lacunae]RDK05341.1 hypothetical protein DN412_37625 [Cupriavidus lacunae]
MKPYFLSLVAGVLAGAIYALLAARSPAPPTLALVVLLGILLGEQVVPVAKRIGSSVPFSAALFYSQQTPGLTGATARRTAQQAFWSVQSPSPADTHHDRTS